MLRPNSTVVNTDWFKVNLAQFKELWAFNHTDAQDVPFGLPLWIRIGPQELSLQVVDADFIYYADENEGDDNGNTVMYDYGFDIVSHNYFANEEMRKHMSAENEEPPPQIIWESDNFKYAKQESLKEELANAPATLRRQIKFLDGFSEAWETECRKSTSKKPEETDTLMLMAAIYNTWLESESLPEMCADDLRHALRSKLAEIG